MIVQSNIDLLKPTVAESGGIAPTLHPQMLKAGMPYNLKLTTPEGGTLIIFISEREYTELKQSIAINDHIL